MKTHLLLRPMWHHVAQRVQAHIFVCVLAYLRIMHDVLIGDILLEATDGRKLRLRRIARPNGTQAELLAALGLVLPERLCADCDVTETDERLSSPPR